MSSSEVLSVQLVERLVCELVAEAVDGGHGNSDTAAENVLTRQERRGYANTTPAVCGSCGVPKPLTPRGLTRRVAWNCR
jgi:hypothetical protein